MGNQLLNWALKQTDVTGPAKCVLLVLANRAHRESRQCFPSLDQLIADSGFGNGTVCRALNWLEAHRKIQRERRGAKTTIYTVRTLPERESSPPIGTVPERESELSQSGSLPEWESLPEREPVLPEWEREPERNERKESHQRKERKERNPTHNNRSTPLARPRDKATDIFGDVFRELNPGCEYGVTKADWVQLAAWRRTQHIEHLQAPDNWRQTCMHYLSSPLVKPTLADLTTKYATYVKGPTDRYQIPIGANGNGRTKFDDTTLANIAKISARLDRQDRLRRERQSSGGDHRSLSGAIDLAVAGETDSGGEPDD